MVANARGSAVTFFNTVADGKVSDDGYSHEEDGDDECSQKPKVFKTEHGLGVHSNLIGIWNLSKHLRQMSIVAIMLLLLGVSGCKSVLELT